MIQSGQSGDLPGIRATGTLDSVAHFTAIRAILSGALIVALLDGLYAVILALRGVTPDRVFQGVAAGVLGREAFRGGMATAALGLGLHVFIALVVVATYVALSIRLGRRCTRGRCSLDRSTAWSSTPS